MKFGHNLGCLELRFGTRANSRVRGLGKSFSMRDLRLPVVVSWSRFPSKKVQPRKFQILPKISSPTSSPRTQIYRTMASEVAAAGGPEKRWRRWRRVRCWRSSNRWRSRAFDMTLTGSPPWWTLEADIGIARNCFNSKKKKNKKNERERDREREVYCFVFFFELWRIEMKMKWLEWREQLARILHPTATVIETEFDILIITSSDSARLRTRCHRLGVMNPNPFPLILSDPILATSFRFGV